MHAKAQPVRRRAKNRRLRQAPTATRMAKGPLAPDTVKPSVFGQMDAEYATTSRRVAAYFVDGALLLAVWLGAGQVGLRQGGNVAGVPLFLISTTAGFAYYALCWWRFAATPGQRALGLRVVDAQARTRVGLDQAVIRWCFLVFLPDTVGALGATMGAAALAGLASSAYAFVLLATTVFGPEHQGLHDRLAGTVVLTRAPADAPLQSLKVLV